MAGTWDAHAAHLKLKHLLALIKGELGLQEVEAPYVMVHRGLQGSWDKLGALECGVVKDRRVLALKADDLQVGLILTQATAVWNKAAPAESLADQLIAMGGTGRITELNEDLKLLTARIQKLEDTMEKASEFCLNLSTHMSTLSMSGSAASARLVLMEDFLKFKAAHDDALATFLAGTQGRGHQDRGCRF